MNSTDFGTECTPSSVLSAITIAYCLIVFIYYFARAAKNKKTNGYFSVKKAMITTPNFNLLIIISLLMVIIAIPAAAAQGYATPLNVASIVITILTLIIQKLVLNAKSRDISGIFIETYASMLGIAKSSPLSHNAESELLPAIFVVTDFAALSSSKNRQAIANEVMSVIRSLDKNFNKSRFDKRCDLYGEIIRGKELRCDWSVVDPSMFYDNAVSKCAALLGDILYNPACADSYDNAPVLINDIRKVMTFSEHVVLPLYEELTKLFCAVHDS